MAQLLIPVDPRLSDNSTVFWSPGTDGDVRREMECLNSEVVGYAREALAKSDADPEIAEFLVRYLSCIRSHAERAWFVSTAAAMVGDCEPALVRQVQAAVELRYWGTLILDDVADQSRERCGAPTLHIQIGEMEAVYLGELLFAAAQAELVRFLEKAGVSNALLFETLHSWLQTHARVNSAQYMDLLLSRKSLDEVSPDDALNLIEGTTAVELANCFFLGGGAGTVDGQSLAKLRRLGTIVGLLMQARDDCLDFVEDATLLNKEPLLDVRNGRKKVALVVGYHHCSPIEQEEINRLISGLGSLSPSEGVRLRELVFNPLAQTYLSRLRDQLLEEAETILENGGWRTDAADKIWRFLAR